MRLAAGAQRDLGGLGVGCYLRCPMALRELLLAAIRAGSALATIPLLLLALALAQAPDHGGAARTGSLVAALEARDDARAARPHVTARVVLQRRRHPAAEASERSLRRPRHDGAGEVRVCAWAAAITLRKAASQSTTPGPAPQHLAPSTWHAAAIRAVSQGQQGRQRQRQMHAARPRPRRAEVRHSSLAR